MKDEAQNDNGGATGGGKLSGATEQGLHGPTPPPAPEKMARLSGAQAKIRQEAEATALKLRKYKLPSGDLEAAVASGSTMVRVGSAIFGSRATSSVSPAV